MKRVIKGSETRSKNTNPQSEYEYRRQVYLRRKHEFETLGEEGNNDVLSRKERMSIAKAEMDKVAPKSIKSAEDATFKNDKRLSPTSERYKGYLIVLDRGGDGYNVYDKHRELEDAGYPSLEAAKQFIDELIADDSICSSEDTDILEDEFARIDRSGTDGDIAIAAIMYNLGVSLDEARNIYHTLSEDKIAEYVEYYNLRDLPRDVRVNAWKNRNSVKSAEITAANNDTRTAYEIEHGITYTRSYSNKYGDQISIFVYDDDPDKQEYGEGGPSGDYFRGRWTKNMQDYYTRKGFKLNSTSYSDAEPILTSSVTHSRPGRCPHCSNMSVASDNDGGRVCDSCGEEYLSFLCPVCKLPAVHSTEREISDISEIYENELFACDNCHSEMFTEYDENGTVMFNVHTAPSNTHWGSINPSVITSNYNFEDDSDTDSMLSDLAYFYSTYPEAIEPILLNNGSDPNNAIWYEGCDISKAYQEAVEYFEAKYDKDDPYSELDTGVGSRLGWSNYIEASHGGTFDDYPDEYPTDYRFYVYDAYDKVVSDPFYYVEDAIDFAVDNNYPIIKKHLYYIENNKHYPDGDPVVIWQEGEAVGGVIKYPDGTPVPDGGTTLTHKMSKSIKSSSDGFDQYEEDIQEISQEFTSENTSINSGKLPAIFNMVSFKPGTINIDYGGGRFDNVAEYLSQYDVINLVYDPYNRTPEHNKEVIRTVRRSGGADTATCSNVLNVIKEPEVRKNVLENIKKLVKPTGVVYITVYEGTGKGNEGPTKSGYQMNRKTADYLSEIQEVFPDATRKGKLIIAHPNNVSSATIVSAESKKTGVEWIKSQIQDAISAKLEGDGWEKDEISENVFVEVKKDNDYIHIEVRAELSYKKMRELANLLDPIVQSYDDYAYFDDVDYGIIEAYIRNLDSINSAINIKVPYHEPWMDVPEDKSIELDDITQDIEIDFEDVIVVQSNGDWDYEDNTCPWADNPDNESGDWTVEDDSKIILDDSNGVVEKLYDLLEKHIPGTAGKYKISGTAHLRYIATNISSYRTEWGEDDYEDDIIYEGIEIEYDSKNSAINNFQFKAI